MSTSFSQRLILDQLTEQIRQCQDQRRGPTEEMVSSGIPALDRLLPAGGFRRGTLIEWVSTVPGSGATRLALATARTACSGENLLVVVDRRGEFYPPALTHLGWKPEQLVVVRPGNAADEAWSIDQALRCDGVGAVLGWPTRLDDHTFRRWQLAAEASGGLGLLVRPAACRTQPSWAEVKLLITPLADAGLGEDRRWRLEILRCGGRNGRGAACEVRSDQLLPSAFPKLRTPYAVLPLSS